MPSVTLSASAEAETVKRTPWALLKRSSQSRNCFLGVQWHPEVYYKEDEKAAALFRAFTEACRGKEGA